MKVNDFGIEKEIYFNTSTFKNSQHFAQLYFENIDQSNNLSYLITFGGQRFYFSISALGIVSSKTYLIFLLQSKIKCEGAYLHFLIFIL